MIRRSRKKWLVAWLILVGTVVVVVCITWPHERLLLSRSTQIASKAEFDDYDWDSNRSVLLYENSVANKAGSLYHLDVFTKQRKADPALAKRIGEHGDRVWQFETSPDGTWLLWTAEGFEGKYFSNGGRSIAWLTNLKSGSFQQFEIGSIAGVDTFSPKPLYWSADSKHIVEFNLPDMMLNALGKKSHSGPTLVRDVNAPFQTVKLKPRSDWDLQFSSQIRVLSESRVVAATSSSYSSKWGFWGVPTLVQTAMAGDATPAKRKPLSMPYNTLGFQEVAFTPHGDRYAIAAAVDSRAAWLDAVHRWIPAIRAAPREQVGIWIGSVADGHTEEIGHLTPERSKEPVIVSPYVLPRDLRWSPDGKHIAFRYKDGLYIVPTD